MSLKSYVEVLEGSAEFRFSNVSVETHAPCLFRLALISRRSHRMSFQICIKTEKNLEQLVSEIRDLFSLPSFKQGSFSGESYCQFEVLGLLILIHRAEEEDRDPEVMQYPTALTYKWPLPITHWTPMMWSTACSPTAPRCSVFNWAWIRRTMRSRRRTEPGRYATTFVVRTRAGMGIFCTVSLVGNLPF